jgi:hypothetical protein
MKKSPEERFATVSEVVEALKPLAKSPAGRSQPRSLPGRDHAGRDASPPSKTNPQAAPEGLMSLPGPAKPGAAPKASASVSTPTPKPQGLGALPSRNSLKGAAPGSAAPVKPEPKAEPAKVRDEQGERVVPGAGSSQNESSSWDEPLGRAAISLAVVAGCVLVYLVAIYFRLL